MKGFIKIIIIIAVLVGAWFAWSLWKGEEKSQISYQTEPVKRGDLSITIEATGVTEPEELVDVGAQVSGIIVEFGKDEDGKTVDYSSRVKAGQMLAEIDKLPVQMDVQQAEATKTQAEAAIAKAKADIEQAKAKHRQKQLDRERAEKLGPGDALSRSSYDEYIVNEETARADVAVAEASLLEAEATLKRAEAALKQQLRNLEYTTISSPVDGVIITRLVNIGQTVVSNMSASSLFYIATDLSKMKIWAAVNEADIANIKKGQKVEFTVDALPNRKFTGTVDKVRLNATMSSNVVTYVVEIDVPNPDKILLPYLTATVQFIVQDYKNEQLVSNAVLRYVPEMTLVTPDQWDTFMKLQDQANDPKNAEENLVVVWELQNNALRPHLVKKGDTDGMKTVIKGDTVKDGMTLVSGAQMQMKNAEAEADEEAGSSGSENPFAPKPPTRRKPSIGGGQQAGSEKNAGGPDGPPPN